MTVVKQRKKWRVLCSKCGHDNHAIKVYCEKCGNKIKGTLTPLFPDNGK